jgi:UDP-N-acetylglucosamine 1-carboxyvinyltransferase
MSFVRKRPEDIEFERRVGKLVRQVRINAGLNQTQLAHSIGTSQSAISEIETASVGCTVWLLRRIARGLGFEMKIVFERKNYETS